MNPGPRVLADPDVVISIRHFTATSTTSKWPTVVTYRALHSSPYIHYRLDLHTSKNPYPRATMSDILPASPASTGDESAYIEDTTLVEITGNSPKHSLLSEAHVLEDVMDEGAPLTLARIVSRLKVRRTSQASSHGCSASSSRSSDTFASSSASSLAPILDESLALSHTPSLSIALAPGASPLHPSDLELTRPADSSLEAKYQSMVLISLAARRDALTWRKMARYWEARARTAEARPSSGVTPSASGMSDLGAEPLDPDRLRAVRELMAARSIPESFLVGIPLEGDEGSAEAFSTSLLPQGNVDGSTEQDHRGGSACATGSRSSISEAASHPVPDKSRTETSKQGPKSVCRPTIAKPRATPVVAPQRRTVPVARSATVRPTPRPTTKVRTVV
jgi:hypothetical protein